MTKIYLITGFLGAGKTSFLQNILQEDHGRVGVLINEFGKASIDGATLSKPEVDLIELTNGSIFCSCLKEHFIEGLKSLIQRGLDTIFVESSGLADPSNMGSILDMIKSEVSLQFLYVANICIVDAVYFKKELELMVSVERQIKHSHFVIINKVDLVSEDQITEIRKIVSELNPYTQIFKSSFAQISLSTLQNDDFLEAVHQPEVSTNRTDNRPMTFVMELREAVVLTALDEMLKALAPLCYRIKGYVDTQDGGYKIDTVLEIIQVIKSKNSCVRDRQKLVFISAIGVKLTTKLVAEAEKHFHEKYQLFT